MKWCHHKFKSKLRQAQNGKQRAEQYRIKYRMYNPLKVKISNRNNQKIFKEIRKIIKGDMMPVIINGKAA
jgi:hypothetical protein